MVYTVLHCLARMNRGGAETLIMNVFRHIDRTKYKFCFLLNDEVCDYTEEIKQLGGEIYVIPTRSQGLISYCRSLNSFFKAYSDRFDAVHLHTSSLSSLEILFYAKKYGITKRVIHSHNTVQAGILHNVLHWCNKPCLRFLATDYLSCSQVASNWLYKFTGVLDKSVVVNNGINLNQFQFSLDARNRIREKYGICKDTIVIGHIGRFDIVKNHTFLIDVYVEFLKLHPNSILMLIGTGVLFEEMKNKANQIGLGEKIIFAGLQSAINEYLSSFDYFVFPSLYEGLPVALVEAQSSGVMTICSDKVSKEAKISEYLSYYELEKSAKDWAHYINSIELLDRLKFVHQLEDNGYSINKTVQYLSTEIYI